MREYQYREGYARSFERKRVEWARDDNVEHMWEQVKRAMVEIAREVCVSVRVGEGSPKSMWWNDEVKAAVKRKVAAWKEMLGARDKMQNKDVWRFTKKKGERLKDVYIRARRRYMNSLEGRGIKM